MTFFALARVPIANSDRNPESLHIFCGFWSLSSNCYRTMSLPGSRKKKDTKGGDVKYFTTTKKGEVCCCYVSEFLIVL
jgi:hypothetical protein